ncbi:MAG: class I SAM-dependent methyltransferase [Micromonosporaceae bacterium]
MISLEDYKRDTPLGEIEEFLACTLCDETRQQPLFRPRADNGKWEYRVVRCPGCGFMYRNPNVLPERLGDLYSGNYSKFLTGHYGSSRQRRYRLAMSSLGEIFQQGEGRRLLDFGCGAGLFLEVAEERGFECYGVDLSPDSIDQAKQRLRTEHVHYGDPMDVPEIAAGNFDVITMWSVLAHLPRPIDDISKLRSLLKPDGVLVILTVNAASMQIAINCDKWNGFTKNHLMFFSRETLPRLLSKAGFAGVGFTPHYSDDVEAGASPLSPREIARLKRRIGSTDGGNMMRAVGFATEAAMTRWGSQLPEMVSLDRYPR